MDETLALPSEKAVEIALRTQQLLAFETGVANVVDPLGGSWYVESLTDKMEKGVMIYLNDIEKNGGVIECIENGYFQKEIANSSSDYNEKLEKGDRYLVGVNQFINQDEEIDIPLLRISKKVEKNQIKRLNVMKKKRNNTDVEKKLKLIKKACHEKQNLVPLIIDAALEYATLGEIVDAMKSHFGEWQEKSII